MSADEIIIRLLCRVDDQLEVINKHSDARWLIGVGIQPTRPTISFVRWFL